MSNKHGAGWITRKRRHGIYARDFHRCVYCGGGEHLTLGHLRARIDGGSNRSSNLVTACVCCNSSRGCRSVRGFCIAVAAYIDMDWRIICARVKSAARRKVPC